MSRELSTSRDRSPRLKITEGSSTAASELMSTEA